MVFIMRMMLRAVKAKMAEQRINALAYQNVLYEPEDDYDASESPETYADPNEATEGGDDDDPVVGTMRGTINRGTSDSDSDEDHQVWEIGIRRSSTARSSRIEDLTLSDIILDPEGNVSYYWKGIVTMAVLYNIVVIVLRLAFKDMRDEEVEKSTFYILDTVADLTYVLDIVVHLRVSFYEDGCLVLNPNRIVEQYTKGTKFILDIAAIFPLETVYMIIAGVGSVVYLDPTEYIAGDIRIMLVRIPRLLKYPAMVKFFDLTDSRTRNPNFVRASKLSLNLWVVIHWIGCFYYMVSEYEGLGTNSWVYPNGTEYNVFTRKYIRVMYWSLMTLTTIGERPAPETDLEYVFTGMTFLIGVFVFAAVVGNVGDVISNMNASRQEFQSRMDQIKSYLNHRNVDEKLQNRVKRWAEYTWNRTQAIDEPALLLMLPDRLRTEIAINVHLDTLKKVKIFEECEEGLLRELVLKLRPQLYSPGDHICRVGEVGREMFIVNHGKVEILVPQGPTGRRTMVATLNPGNYFGEISLLKLDEGQNRRTADVKAVGYSELLRLSRKDLMSALVEYPDAKRILEQQAKERIQRTKEVRSTSSVATDNPPPPDIAARAASASVAEESQPVRKRDMFLQVVKSDNFQKLISSRQSEIKDLKGVLSELRRFDSQATKDTIEKLTFEKQGLEKKLKEKDAEYMELKIKYTHLVANQSVTPFVHRQSSPLPIDESQSTTSLLASQSTAPLIASQSDSSVISNGSHNNSTGVDVDRNLLCSRVPRARSNSSRTLLEDIAILRSADHIGCLAENLQSSATNNASHRADLKNRKVKHLPKCPSAAKEDRCKCRTLRHTSSSPNVVKRLTSSIVSGLAAESKQADVKPSTAHKKSEKGQSRTLQRTIPSIEIDDMSTDDVESGTRATSANLMNDPDLADLHELWALEAGNYMSDSSLRSSDISSDDDDDIGPVNRV